jgi:membrane fusion protein (multidrug efflux system)
MKTETIEGQETESRTTRNGATAAAVAAPAPVPEETVAVRKSRRGSLMVGIAGVVVAASIGAYLLITGGRESTDDAQVSADIVPIGTRVAGQIVQVHIVENQLVKKGDTVAEIDDADYVARE